MSFCLAMLCNVPPATCIRTWVPNTVAGSVIAEWDGHGPPSTRHVIWFVWRDVVRHHDPAALADSARSCGQLCDYYWVPASQHMLTGQTNWMKSMVRAVYWLYSAWSKRFQSVINNNVTCVTCTCVDVCRSSCIQSTASSVKDVRVMLNTIL
jgi:hypothetical protein